MHDPEGPETKLARAVEAQLDGLSAQEIRALIEHHLRRIGVWGDPELTLDFSDVTSRSLTALAWEMADVARANPYLHSLSVAAAPHAFGELSATALAQSRAVAREALTFAVVLERMARAVLADPAHADAMIRRLRARGGLLGEFIAYGPPRGYKAHIIQTALGLLTSAQHGHDTPLESLRQMLQLNINYITIFDEPANNEAALRLSARAAAIGGGRAAESYSIDPKLHLVRSGYLADTAEWVFMYGTWNVIYGMQLDVFPFFLTKLLIPAVGGASASPETYMHRRVIALYLFDHWLLNGKAALTTGERLRWKLPKLAKALSPHIRANTAQFEARAIGAGYGAGQRHPAWVRWVNCARGTPSSSM